MQYSSQLKKYLEKYAFVQSNGLFINNLSYDEEPYNVKCRSDLSH